MNLNRLKEKLERLKANRRRWIDLYFYDWKTKTAEQFIDEYKQTHKVSPYDDFMLFYVLDTQDDFAEYKRRFPDDLS